MKTLAKKIYQNAYKLRHRVIPKVTTNKEKEETPKNQINIDPIKRLFENPQKSLEPYVRKGQVVVDLACNTGYYTLALAECVGPEGKVYAVDLNEKVIQEVKRKVDKSGYHNIELHASSAADLSFIKDGSVDFVLANGLLCSMSDQRPSAVNEIKRILKPNGQAYLSLGGSPPLGYVNRAEWEKILEGFRVKRKGSFLFGFQKWAVVST
jgi:ubiquinone/menaquinone biosynthesis C-methylase UbiE